MSNARHRANALVAMTAIAATIGLAGCSKTAPGVPVNTVLPTVPSPTVTDQVPTPAQPGTGVDGSVTAKDFGGIMLPPGSTLKDDPFRIGSSVTAQFSTSNPKAAFKAIRASALQNGFAVGSDSIFYEDLNAGSITATKGSATYRALFSKAGISVSYTDS